MIKYTFLFTLVLMVYSAKSQDILTRGQVYDFEIGDVFHIKHMYPYYTLIQRRMIIDKRLSDNLDSVFYSVYRYDYSSEPGPTSNPTIYTNYNDTIYLTYTNLNAPITTFGDSTIYNEGSEYEFVYYPDTINYIDSNFYCGVQIIGYSDYPPVFEANVVSKRWGKGLGQVLQYQRIGSSPTPHPMTDWRLFYYKKNNVECGTPDNKFLNINDYNNLELSIYPNPSKDKFHIVTDQKSNLEFQLVNQIGQQVNINIQDRFNGYEVNTTSLLNGIYYLIITNENQASTYKIIVNQ